MGGDRVTVKNLVVMSYNKDTSELYIRGAVPGRRGTVVEVQG
jgi:ribosomal protein L3